MTRPNVKNRDEVRSMRIRMTMLATVLMFLFVSPGLYASETRDPYVYDPLGPYTLLSNPASVIDVQALLVRAAMGFGHDGTTSALLAYMEPDMGLGAGALYWHTLSPADGNRRQEIGYTLARQAASNVYYGFTIKQLSEGSERVWAADFGLFLRDLNRFRVGFTAHNFLGQSAINPLHVTGAIAYEVSPLLGLGLFASAPFEDDGDGIDVGIAVDVKVMQGAQIRLGRIHNLRTAEDYWLGGLTYDFEPLTFDASVLFDRTDNVRFAIGVVYRF